MLLLLFVYLRLLWSLTPARRAFRQVALPYTGDYEIKYATPALMNDCPTTGCVENSDPAQAVGKWIALEFNRAPRPAPSLASLKAREYVHWPVLFPKVALEAGEITKWLHLQFWG